MRGIFILCCLLFTISSLGQTAHTVARKWNDLLLEAIRNDLARPTVHARNLFHVSAAMYDAWAVYEPKAKTYFLGKTVGGYYIPFDSVQPNSSQSKVFKQVTAMSYAAYQLIKHRFRNSPGASEIAYRADSLLIALGYIIQNQTDYYISPHGMGNYIAEQVINYGLQDGANESGDYANEYYEPVNNPLDLTSRGSNSLADPNRWQALQFRGGFIDQSGNPIPAEVIDFLSPEWGDVVPFSFRSSDMVTQNRDENEYQIFKDPGPPPYIDTVANVGIQDPYKWGFALVSAWSSHLDPTDGVMMDISPNSIGNISIESLPTEISAYEQFYDWNEGGDPSPGYDENPITGEAYEEQIVPRADYARVLAEFWADGPDSETPPGHWFTILNYVHDHPAFSRRFMGEGEEMDPLEWDVKAYFMLGGAMHDAAIAAWSVKGYYDYIRPISAIRYMATRGQSTDEALPNYSPAGLPLVEGYIELVGEGDPLVGAEGEFLNELKVKAWRGHQYIQDPSIDTAGVGWILAKDWWPYQRPSFVTPPFAGYVSGHSTYSRAAAEVLTLLTGSEYFPGGMGEFHAPQNDFLVFERGPSVDVTLQWAKYYDASDQCSLSRIWGGIHPPADDLPGRLMGAAIGQQAFDYARSFFEFGPLDVDKSYDKPIMVYPNPARSSLDFRNVDVGTKIVFISVQGEEVAKFTYRGLPIELPATIHPGLYFIKIGENTEKLLIRD